MSSTITLTSAVTSGDESAVSALLANGADVNETSSGGRTPLILAVINGHTHIVQRLVQAGADPQQRDNLGLNAIEWAQRRGLSEALDILTNPQRASSPPKKIIINFEEPEKPEVKPVAPEPEVRDSVPEDEKSRRWIAGLRQRLEEQELRLNQNGSPAEVRTTRPPEPEPEPEPEIPQTRVLPEPEPEPVQPRHSTRILTPAPLSTSTGNRKRCPQCYAVYNGDLVSYCAIDMAPLVDAD
ncbi:MAG TPA: ankyrin repeat domain-containing protein, partial [Pyrinomonadaceae bacterium]|nr:ankyrin repeat domain-containing protein [Pyrinomonadaceae bacterium]